MKKMDNLFFLIGIILIILGFIALMVGTILSTAGGEGKSEVRGAAVAFIGPIPIAFGTDTASVVVVAVVMLVLMLLYLMFAGKGFRFL